MEPDHQRMSRLLGYCLILNTVDAWFAFSAVATARLSEIEREALALAALNALEPDRAEAIAAMSIGSVGYPLPAFLGDMNEARSWASYATRTELKAYALAAYEALPMSEQMAFRNHISEVEIAA